MKAKEREEIMRYVGQLEGLCMTMYTDDDQETAFIHDKLMSIASDIEAVVKGYDHYDIPNLTMMRTTSGPLEGGDDDDV